MYSKRILVAGIYIVGLGLLSCNKSELSLPDSKSNIQNISTNRTESALFAETTNDGGFIYGGTTNFQAFLLKLDSNGIKEWYQSTGFEDEDVFRAAIATKDNGIIAVGQSNDLEVLSNPVGFIAKFGDDGELIWQKTYATDSVEELHYRAVAVANNGSIFTLEHNISKFGLIRYLVKFSSQGALLWKKNLELLSPPFFPRALLIDQKGDLVIEGNSRLSSTQDAPSILKMKPANGSILFHKPIPSCNGFIGYANSSLQEVLNGYQWLYEPRESLSIKALIQVDFNGEYLNELTFNQDFNGFAENDIGETLFFGFDGSNPNNSGSIKCYAQFRDSENEEIWTNIFGNDSRRQYVLNSQFANNKWRMICAAENDLTNNLDLYFYTINKGGIVKYEKNK